MLSIDLFGSKSMETKLLMHRDILLLNNRGLLRSRSKKIERLMRQGKRNLTLEMTSKHKLISLNKHQYSLLLLPRQLNNQIQFSLLQLQSKHHHQLQPSQHNQFQRKSNQSNKLQPQLLPLHHLWHHKLHQLRKNQLLHRHPQLQLSNPNKFNHLHRK